MNGQEYGLFSDGLQKLIDRAYLACFNRCEDFRKALIDSGYEKLIHSIGKSDMHKTILTEYNFVIRLENLRKMAKEQMNK